MALPGRSPGDEENGVEDMIKLTDLNEHSILKNLRTRYENGLIYTYTGSILVAVNPYKMFSIYGLDMVKKYEGQPLGDLAPHLFAVGSASYTKMIKDAENQVLVISGESGAGKTESTKLIMQYLAAVNKSGNNLITEQILEANPLLESFGNAKTIRNDNSSRFGKYIEVHFKNGAIVGAKTSEYLLEKSRIVTQAPEERNYHVFYEMLESLPEEEKGKYGLQTAPKYFYLNQGGSSLIPGRDDASNYRKLTDAMDILNFERKEQETIIKILASVLHIGNIYFKNVNENNHDTVQLGSEAEIKWISYLLGLTDDAWLKQALISKVTEARGDRVISPYNLDQALDARDAIAKAVYSRLFTWLVEKINYIICRSEREKSSSLAVLDIFGFEDFHLNSFEQLCINYANETLQYFFNQHVFRLEQKEYNKEKIQWQHIEFKDNQPTIDLIATKPAGILHILDDESNFPKATDQSFLEKCHFHHSGNDLYDKPRMSDPEFFIAHYAGKIKYNVQHFLEKNKDTLRSDVIELLCESNDKMISQMFKDLRDKNITKTLSKTTGRYVTLKPRTTTIAASFNESLLSLIDTMSRCNPYFVRCIKPNASKSPMVFEDIVVLDQLRYTGMLETIRIRRMGYPVRIKFPQFFERYRCLLKGQKIKNSSVPWDVCKLILQTQGPDAKLEYQIGATKVFMKENFEMRLDLEARRIQSQAVIRLQTFVRMFVAFKRHQKMRRNTLKIQRMMRMVKARRDFKAVRHGFVLAQAQYRMYRQRKLYLKSREEIRHRLEQERIARKKQEVQERLEREKRERQAQMMASIANLEIPPQLAYVLSKTHEWDLPHKTPNIITAMGDVIPMDMGYKLPADINSHVFSKFTSVYFKNPMWGVTMEPISTSLTPIQDKESIAQAVSVFKLILRFMCTLNMSEKRAKILADFIVNMGLRNEALRDEILCQLVNQVWMAQSREKTERVWLLLICCLCCFNPSVTLFKYLLKFVSDVGINKHNISAQHKILQSAYMDPKLSRVYPPTYLEWKAIQKKANMALEVAFPDGVNVIGHVESWTSGELFTSHLLKLRGLNENCHGWTVILNEDVDYYELMGYDYVLDLVSEIEVPPGFPAHTAYFLVSVDKSRERKNVQQHYDHAENAHNPDKDRIIVLTGPLPEMIPSKLPGSASTGLTASQLYHQQQHNKSQAAKLVQMIHLDDLGFSKTSILNQRPTEILPSGLSENSRMNTRYTKRSRAPAPPATNGFVNGIANGHITTINEDEEEDFSDLSGNKLNSRYFPNGDVVTNGVAATDLSQSKLNSRYAKNTRNARGRHTSREDGISVNSDMSQQVDDIFKNALKFHDEQDGRVLGSRIKGGGQGVPGVQAQQPQPLNQPLNLIGLGLQQPVVPPLNLTGITSPLSPTVPDPLQQVAAQQMAQQQAILQAYLTQQQQQQQQQQAAAQAALLQASLQQQQQQQQQQAALQSSQQQTAVLKTAIQQQELQNTLLKQSIEQEVLRSQLQQVQLQQRLPLTPMMPQQGVQLPPLNQGRPLSMDSSFGSGLNMSNVSSNFAASSNNPPLMNGMVNGQVPVPKPSEAAAPRRVKFMKTAFESKAAEEQLSPPFTSPRHSVQFDSNPHQVTASTNVTRSINITSTTTTDVPIQHITAPSTVPAAPPPPPPISFADGPPLHTQPSRPPTPPPPPPLPANIDIDKDHGTFTIRGKDGRARTIRVGRVVWPPPKDGEEKPQPKVGKLEINEQVANNIESNLIQRPKKRILPTKYAEGSTSVVRSESVEESSSKLIRAKSLVDTSHIHTLRLLEMKLSGKGERPTEPKSPEVETPKPKESTYNTTIIKDLPILPPPPPAPLPPPVPPSTVKTVTTTETIETVETRQLASPSRLELEDLSSSRGSGDYSIRIQDDSWIDKDIPLALPTTEPKMQIDYAAFEKMITELYPQNKAFFLMYNKVPWTLHIRKEVFWPLEKLDKPMAVHLVYCQVVTDVYNNGCIRINRDQRVKMKGMLDGYGVDASNFLTKDIKPQIKKVIVDTAREWPIYFSRLFPIAAGGQQSQASHLGVSHTGLRLVTRDKNIVEDNLSVMEEIRFEDVVDVLLPSDSCLQINLRTKSLIFHTNRAHQLKDMIDRFCAESEKGNKFVVAIKDYITRESTLLSFKRGEIIKLMDPEMDLEEGWLYGSLNGIVGLFPAEYVKPLARHEIELSSSKPVLYQAKPLSARQESQQSRDDHSETSQGTVIADGKFSMMEYAMLHFRESLEKPRRGTEWTWKEQAEMVKWTRSPIQASLLKLNSAELNKVALECFIAIMRFMGDYPMGTNMSDFDCVKKILRGCHKYPPLRDEVFCQLCKQTTNNRSMFHKSKIRGWRLFALVAAYYDCSETLRPYLFKYLETTSSDVTRTYNSAAALCLNNLRKTFKYGGRKDVPLKEEVVALADGRNCKRIPYFYPGITAQGGILQVKSCTVVQDSIEDICRDLNISDVVEMDEYTLFVRSGDGSFSKLNREDYILDEAAYYVRRQMHFDFIFQRTVWYFPIKALENNVYVDMFFHQVILDYIEGFLLIMPGGRLPSKTIDDVALLGALLFKANNFHGVPTLKDLASMLPGNLRLSPEAGKQQQWLNRIHDSLARLGPMSSIRAKAQFIDVLKTWHLFGSTFFKIKRIPNVSGEALLAINKDGISFLSYDTHETIMHHSFSEILSTRRYRSDSNVNYLDMKLGNLMVQQILRIETDQGSDISDLIGQYMQVINRYHKRQARSMPSDGH